MICKCRVGTCIHSRLCWLFLGVHSRHNSSLYYKWNRDIIIKRVQCTCMMNVPIPRVGNITQRFIYDCSLYFLYFLIKKIFRNHCITLKLQQYGSLTVATAETTVKGYAANTVSTFIPRKSKHLYEQTYERLNQWCAQKKIKIRRYCWLIQTL